MNKNSVIKGSFVLALGAFFSKLLGAVYRIPLMNIIGANGIGLYQMIFPVYCIMLDFAGCGAPNAIAKIVAETSPYNEKRRKLKSSIFILFFLGLFFSLFMLVFAPFISRLQGNSDATIGYIFLSPAVVFVSLISAFRGYYQGKMNMVPTAISQITEQIVKLIFGLGFAYLFYPNIPLCVGGATLAVSVSEFFAFCYLFIKYKKESKNQPKIPLSKSERNFDIKELIKLTVPFTLVGIILPFSAFLDSFYTVNILNKNFSNATSLYGLFSGGALTVINLPVSVCYGIAVVTIPLISSKENKMENAKKSLWFTFTVSLVLALICYFCSGIITDILYSNVPFENRKIIIRLIKIMSINVVLLSLLQTQNSLLIALNKRYFPLISMGIGIILKTVISIILLSDVKMNIYGLAIGLIACYFFSVLINFIWIKEQNRKWKLSRYR